MRLSVPQEEFTYSGHNGCPGCGAAQSLRYTFKALGPKTIATIPACCSSGLAGGMGLHNFKIPVYHTAFASTAAVASGLRAGLDAAGDTESTVLAWAGDGGTYDIGIQALSAAAERNERFVYVCYDNEAYMMTGIQRSSSTPKGSWTMTTPAGGFKQEKKKNIMDIMVAHGLLYAATATTAYPEDLIAKVKEAQKTPGLAFIQIFSPCPTGWRFPSELSVKASRTAVESKLFPLYEVRNGTQYRITVEPKGIPVKEYIKIQGRFAHFKEEDYAQVQADVDAAWERLQKKVRAS